MEVGLARWAAPIRRCVESPTGANWAGGCQSPPEPYNTDFTTDGKVSPEVQYVASLYKQLADAASIKKPGSFVDRTDMPWEVYYRDGCGDEPRCEDAWVVCELFWGGYVSALPITLAWLLMDAIRLQNGLRAIALTPDSFARFADDLRASGPELFDAESLRGLFFDYETEQMAR